MKKTFSLVQESISHDSVEALETLLSEAKQGKLIGVAFVAMYSDRYYVANAAGEAHRNPVFTSGMLSSLNYQLMQKVNE